MTTPSGPPPVTPAPAVSQPLRTPARSKRARLVVKRIDPWSVMKFTLLFSLCLLIVFVVAVAALDFALRALGVIDSVNKFLLEFTGSGGNNPTGGFQLADEPVAVIGIATIIGLINVVLITAISTLGAFLYNLCADIVGGIEVTLAERD